jgi:hypothetical protein
MTYHHRERRAAAGGRLCLLAALLLVLAGAAPGCTDVPRESGDMTTLATQLEAGVPGAGSGRYVDPNPAQREAFAHVLSLMAAGNLKDAAAAAEPLNYEVYVYTDTVSGCSYDLLIEQTPIAFGWGTYLLNPETSARDIIVEAPHPKADARTPLFAAEICRTLEARALLIAGTHRAADKARASDPTRNANSIFELAHETLSTPETYVIAVHGFTRAKRPAYPDAVYSNGSDDPAPILYALRADLAKRRINCGVFDGRNWRALGATDDLQGAHTRAIKGTFIHAEFSREVREDKTRRATVAESFRYLLTPILDRQRAPAE